MILLTMNHVFLYQKADIYQILGYWILKIVLIQSHVEERQGFLEES